MKPKLPIYALAFGFNALFTFSSLAQNPHWDELANAPFADIK
jgi:hypothetical protein